MGSGNDGRRGPRGALDEAELQAKVESGLTVRELAVAFDRSPSTVRYWLDKYGIELPRPGRRRRHGTDGGTEARITSECSTHGETTFSLRSDGYYRCLRCGTAAVSRRRRKVREILIEEAGGECQLCGFDKLPALEFHHRDRKTKSFGLAARGITRSIESLREEAKKCALLCSNCHALVEAGVLEAPEPPDGGSSVS